MAWEKRGNRSYFYRKKKIKGHVVAEYFGPGWLGQAADLHYREKRIFAGVKRDKRDRERKVETGLDRLVSDFSRQVRDYVAGVLVANGYHRHDRGNWRKRRAMSKPKQLPTAEQTALARQLNDQGLNVLAASTLTQMINAVGLSGESEKALLGDLERLRRGLGWETSSALERLLIECIAVDWLNLQFVTQNLAHNTSETNCKTHSAEHFERRFSMCHHRYLSSTLALARVRRLGNVQINIGQNQVITGG